jgi:peptidoglycan/LPS O-acetylase OafA/YrhL
MRLEVLTGLRGVLLLWVMFIHMPSVVLNPQLTWMQMNIRGGVDFFLAISGFLVTKSILGTGTDDYSQWSARWGRIRKYFVSRIARIFPAYYFFIFVMVALALTVSARLLVDLKSILDIAASFLLFFANYTIPWGLEQTNIHIPKPLLVTWSLSFQEQFYVILAVFFGLSRRYLPWLLAGACLFSIILRLFLVLGPWADQEKNIYYEFWVHLNFDAIGWGCLFWIIRDKLTFLFKTQVRARLTFLALAIVFVVVVITPKMVGVQLYYVVSMTIRSILFALIIVAVTTLEQERSLVSQFLKSRAMTALGNASFEVYLFHTLVYDALLKFKFLYSPTMIPVFYIVGIVVGVSVYRWFSLPMQTMIKKRWQPHP